MRVAEEAPSLHWASHARLEHELHLGDGLGLLPLSSTSLQPEQLPAVTVTLFVTVNDVCPAPSSGSTASSNPCSACSNLKRSSSPGLRDLKLHVRSWKAEI